MPRAASTVVPPPEAPRNATPSDISETGGPSKDKPEIPQIATPEYDTLLAAMEKSGWVQAKAARLLGQTPRQVGYAVRRLGIPIQKF
jgi:Nif-specific regulatory protein